MTPRPGSRRRHKHERCNGKWRPSQTEFSSRTQTALLLANENLKTQTALVWLINTPAKSCSEFDVFSSEIFNNDYRDSRWLVILLTNKMRVQIVSAPSDAIRRCFWPINTPDAFSAPTGKTRHWLLFCLIVKCSIMTIRIAGSCALNLNIFSCFVVCKRETYI